MAKSFGIMMVREYQRIINNTYNDALQRARANVNAIEIEEKAWEILGRPDIYKRRRAAELHLQKIEKELNELSTGSCSGEKSKFDKAMDEAAQDSRKLAWEKVGRLDLYEKEKTLLEEEKKLREKRQKLEEEQAPFTTPGFDRLPRPFDVAYKEFKNTEEERAWKKLGKLKEIEKLKELESELAEIADEAKPFNNHSCELRQKLTRQHYSRSKPYKYETPLEEARWQAKELLFPQETELTEAKELAEKEVILAGVPEKVGDVISKFNQSIDNLLG